MLEVKDLTFSYSREGEKVLDNISFSEEDGRLIAILGANGAGKTTLFRCILGFEKNYEGEVRLDGRELKSLTRREVASLIAYVPQSEGTVFNYTVFDTVLMGTTGTLPVLSAPGEEQIETAKEAIRFLGIEHLAERGVNELSGGERQLVMLARAIAQKAKMMIMDEPTANLDYGNQQLVLRNIRKMTREGYTVVFSTHNPEHALHYASHVLVIKDHKIAAEGVSADTLTEELIKDIYGLETRIMRIEVNGRTVLSCVPISGIEE